MRRFSKVGFCVEFVSSQCLTCCRKLSHLNLEKQFDFYQINKLVTTTLGAETQQIAAILEKLFFNESFM